ncbi:DUF1592 domain-containing protein [Sandaracinus amylolyticus]|uniref:Cellulose-binding domain protein n=1 Tax=Sandaracinus amylolyticus TaxID=927083 RepID=A0A0F6WAD1_9BACT|nr:DUF1592 domain-containing protein [Sandaracinus amylolyticus]AKF11480.1 Cellulose-binding domain protein [Sandaracinus amylolyticus]
MGRSTALFFGLVLALAGCEGTLLDGPTGPRGLGDRGGGGPATCGTPAVAPSAITRLTRTEYDYAIEDLLGDTSRPAREFAPDDITTGFEVGGAVSPLLVEQYLDAATSTAERATADLDALTGCAAGEACASEFIERFGRRAYRRPLTSEESASLRALYREGAALGDHRTGIQVVLEAILVSPSFLYHVEGAEPDAAPGAVMPLSGHEIASRLAFFLWRSVPDEELLDAAEAGELDDPANVEMQARRMLEDARAARGLHDFTRQWLDLDRLGTIEKDSAIHPEFDRALASDMRASIEAYVDAMLRDGGDFDALLVGDGTAYVNERLAPIYGLTGITGEELRAVEIDPSQRGGLLTQPGLLALLAKSNQSDPIHRGIFVRQRLLCQQLPPPPADVDTTPPDLMPGLTTRERFGEHRENPSCAACHSLIDPIGFGFEGYDAIGRFRATEEGQAIDASGEIVSGGDASGAFDGVIELSERLAASETVHECIARQWFRYAIGRIETAQDRCSTDAIDDAFSESGHDVRELVVALVTSDAFTHRRIPEAR